MKKIIVGSMIMVGLLIVSGCSDNSDNATTNTQQSDSSKVEVREQTAVLSLIKDDEEVASKDVSFEEGSDLMTVVKANYEVVEDSGMITAIDGIEQNADEGYYWTYTINDEMVNTGASDTILKDGDKVVFTYAKF